MLNINDIGRLRNVLKILSILAFTLLLTVLFFGLFYHLSNKGTAGYENVLDESYWSLVAIIATVTIFIATELSITTRDYLKQLSLIKSVQTIIRLLIQPSGEIKGHIPYFIDCLGKTPPAHEMMEIDVNFVIYNLDSFIDGNPTIDLKKGLFHVNDKIKMLNHYSKDKRFWKSNKNYIEKVIKELEALLSHALKTTDLFDIN
jgi:hypothetical protein